MSVTGGKTILLVDDELLIAMSEKIALEARGYRVVIAQSGEEAVGIMESTPGIDSILMDINLGSGIDGTEAAGRILARHDIPVVFLSSHTDPEVVERTEKITSYGYVVKSAGITVIDASIKMAFKLFDAKQKIKNELIERRLAEEALRESEERFRVLHNSSFGGIVIHDHGVILECNAGLSEMTGYTRDELLGMNGLLLFAERSRELVTHSFMTCVEEPYEAIGLRKNGEEYDVRLEARNIPYRSKIVRVAELRDITTYKQITEALKKSDESLYTTLQSIGDGVISTDKSGAIVNMNPIAEKLCGWSLAEAAGRHLNDVFVIMNSLTRENVDDPVDIVLETGHIVGLANHTVLISRDGTEYQISDSAAPIKGRDGEITGVVLVFSDITKAYEMRERLRLSEERLDLAMAVKNEGIWDWNLITNETYFDDRYYTMAGYMPLEFPQNFDNWAERVHPDDIEAATQAVRAYHAGQSERYDVDFRFRHKNGSWIWIQGKGKIVDRDSTGRPLRMIGTHTDISERKKVEQELRVKSEELERYFASALDLWCIADTQGNFIRVNREWERTLGYSESLLQNRRFLDFVHPDNMSETLDAMTRLDRQEQVINFVNRFRCHDGSWRWIEWRSQPHGELIYAAGRDITDRLRAEEEIKRQLAEKDLVIREVHHRIKNNIATIASLLTQHMKSIQAPEAVFALQEAIGRIGSMRLLYDNLLSSEDYKEINVKRYAENLVDTVVALFRGKETLTIEKRIDEFSLTSKHLFPLGIIVNELLTNTMKHAFIGRDSGAIDFSLIKDGNQVILTVSDDGVGVPDHGDAKSWKGFGLFLVGMLCEQLCGQLTTEHHQGTRTVLQFSV